MRGPWLAGGKGAVRASVILENPRDGELYVTGLYQEILKNNQRVESEDAERLESGQANFAILRKQWME